MKKFILLFSIALLSFAPGNTVYVCVSPTSIAYHSTEKCRGLHKCTHVISSMTKEEAIKSGKRACKICW